MWLSVLASVVMAQCMGTVSIIPAKDCGKLHNKVQLYIAIETYYTNTQCSFQRQLGPAWVAMLALHFCNFGVNALEPGEI